VLVALSIGYWFGGRLADRHPHCAALPLVLVAACCSRSCRRADPFLSLSVEAFDTIASAPSPGSLFGVLALVACPC
jgi:hypothetical protein